MIGEVSALEIYENLWLNEQMMIKEVNVFNMNWKVKDIIKVQM